MKLFLAPHNDDETLFGAFTLQLHRPLVVIVTDSYVQFNRGDGITADQRWAETCDAMRLLECPVVRLGLRDDALQEHDLIDALRRFSGFETVYAPVVEGGHAHHDLVSIAAAKVFPRQVVRYTTYCKGEGFSNRGSMAVHGSDQMRHLKDVALACYRSQHKRSRIHFKAVAGQPEWLT